MHIHKKENAHSQERECTYMRKRMHILEEESAHSQGRKYVNVHFVETSTTRVHLRLYQVVSHIDF